LKYLKQPEKAKLLQDRQKR
jgi:hypothetical protein